jgi:serine phosphatase RsbU (regulator of sigma subunit)
MSERARAAVRHAHEDEEDLAQARLVVLLVEDDEGDAKLVENELLERLPDASVLQSRTLQDALRRLSPAIDCVLLDLALPDAAGLAAVGRLRQRLQGIPLVVLTGLDDAAAGIAAWQAGAQDYLVKGHVDGDQLVRSIRYAIGRRHAEEAERKLLLADMQAREVARLERGLAPRPLLTGSDAWVACCYRAGRSRALLGGDFYDLVCAPDGRLQVVIGDVCGHGPDEAAIGVSLRAAWRALALAGARPEQLLATLQQVFEHERHLPSLFATLCTLSIDPSQRTASMVRAGHPQPVLIDQRAVLPLSFGSGSTVIGIGNKQWRSERVSLPSRWAILLYTDGLIEGHVSAGAERLGEAGLHRLISERIVAQPTWREDPQALLEALIDGAQRLNGEALSDDVAMLLVGVGPQLGVGVGSQLGVGVDSQLG